MTDMQSGLFDGPLEEQTQDLLNFSTLEEFYEATKSCQKCLLGQTRKNYVFGSGNPKATLMVVGEAPGAEEDEQGLPFVGRSGLLLTKILEAIQFRREDIYIANILKCRPPGNRNPEPDEMACCMPYLKKQIEMINPKIVLALGKIAGNALLENKLSMTAMRGKTHKLGRIDVFVTYHPAALLRNPAWKRFCWDDVRTLKKHYDSTIK